MASQKRVLSGIQPTGDIHLGNYFGAVKAWVDMQKEFDCVFGVVDYHAMTMPYKPERLREATWTMTFQLLACGVEPDFLFIQSLVPEHAELAWILGCMTSYGEVTRMTQFKDKSMQVQDKDKDAFISAGLFFYPILQAADILIYKADYVPVGKDQEQHLELTRNIAERFNRQFGKDYFPLPAPYFTQTPKVLSPADPTRKMSKSLGEKHVINLFGEQEKMRKQIRSAVTDTGDTPAGEMSPGVANLFTLLKASGGVDASRLLMDEHVRGTLRYAELKEVVADALGVMMAPIQDRYRDILADKRTWKKRVQEASAHIRDRARETLREVHEITGLGALR
ncbi:MAG: tryptophan--tRNA ligase [Saprospiraceae bacterium]|nr:tryptophan--tRNA ligase [Saprospiraceae bacterium]